MRNQAEYSPTKMHLRFPYFNKFVISQQKKCIRHFNLFIFLHFRAAATIFAASLRRKCWRSASKVNEIDEACV